METRALIAIDTAALPWEERFNEKLGRAIYRKELITDPDTGMEVRLVRYPAGVINVRHTHPCAHGMYVLSGTLVTHAGRYGPGCFVWFPEGTVMEYGAAPDGDVTVLFITNKPFAIHYQQSGQPRPTNGIVVAITVRNRTLASSGRLAMYTTARATCSTSIVGSTAVSPLAWSTPIFIRAVISVWALPTSIWPQAMSYLRPSNAAERVSPVIACLVAVYGAELGRGT